MNNNKRYISLRKKEYINNIGWFYYRFYYKDLGSENCDLKSNNNALLEAKISDKIDFLPTEKASFSLYTTYPGLIIGTGVTHETGDKGKEEFKLGLSFDYTTGLPVIPGSSLKGLLRSAFPNSIKKGRTPEEEQLLEETYRQPRREYINSILGNIAIDIDDLENEIFEGINAGKNIPVYQRDKFFDAFPDIDDNKSPIFGPDYTTPHADPLKNPIPVCFMKLLPGIKLNFYFKLNSENSIISCDEKVKLFKQILLDLGIGAKTNVGYGQLTENP